MEKISKLTVGIGIAQMVVSAGVGVVVGNFVKATTPVDSTRLHRLLVGIGTYSISAVLGDLAADHVSSQINAYAQRVDEILHPTTEAKEGDYVLKVRESKADEPLSDWERELLNSVNPEDTDNLPKDEV